ncbi:DnaJ-domain-containing protein, partial [Acaromyces ingoldii]
MRLLRSLFLLLLVAAALVSVVSASWDKDDFEIFELQNALEKDEGQGTTFYSILNLTRSASINDIRKAYRARSKELHPDKHPHDSKATKRFERLGVINKILRDERRDRYDHFLTNGFPRWRGTGYYYSRFRPSLAFVLLFIIAATSGVQLLIKMINWRRDVSRLESLRTTAKIMAWGPRF